MISWVSRYEESLEYFWLCRVENRLMPRRRATLTARLLTLHIFAYLFVINAFLRNVR